MYPARSRLEIPRGKSGEIRPPSRRPAFFAIPRPVIDPKGPTTLRHIHGRYGPARLVHPRRLPMTLTADRCPLASPLQLTGADIGPRLKNIISSAPPAVRTALTDLLFSIKTSLEVLPIMVRRRFRRTRGRHRLRPAGTHRTVPGRACRRPMDGRRTGRGLGRPRFGPPDGGVRRGGPARPRPVPRDVASRRVPRRAGHCPASRRRPLTALPPRRPRARRARRRRPPCPRPATPARPRSGPPVRPAPALPGRPRGAPDATGGG